MTRARKTLLAGLALVVLAACERDAPPAAPSGPGVPNAYGAYGPYPPPPDAPPAAWPNGAPPGAIPPPSAGCGKAGAKTGLVQNARVRVKNQDRTYILSVPDAYVPTTAYPLVFALHGGGGNAAGARNQLDLDHTSGGRAIVVWPDAVRGEWDLDDEATKNRDVDLFDMLLFTIGNTYCVDMKRVFVTGFSNGAYMANQLACRRGDKIRAIASHAGGGPYENQGRYDEEGHLLCPGKAVAALVVRGNADGVVQPSEGDASVAHWSFSNRCNGRPVATPPPPCEMIGGCMQPVVSCRIPGLGHAPWQNAKAATWAFFDAQR